MATWWGVKTFTPACYTVVMWHMLHGIYDLAGVFHHVQNPWFSDSQTLHTPVVCVTVSGLTGNGVGDDCESDSDGDGALNSEDDCPLNKFINHTSFVDYTSVILDPSASPSTAPQWEVTDEGSNIRQRQSTQQASMLIGRHSFENQSGPLQSEVET